MTRILTVGYGAVSYVVFLAAILYSIGFVGNFVVPRSIDNGIDAPVGAAVVVNVLLLGLFAVQHSVMARPAFKQWWTRLVPATVERSTYVLLSSLLLFLLFWQWRTMPSVIWDITWMPGRVPWWIVFGLGWLIALLSTFMINHFDLFGLRQVYLAWRAKPYSDVEFRESLLYRMVRHPLLLGFIIAFWATPTMTAGHLLFASQRPVTCWSEFNWRNTISERHSANAIGTTAAASRCSFPDFDGRGFDKLIRWATTTACLRSSLITASPWRTNAHIWRGSAPRLVCSPRRWPSSS